MKNTTHLTKDEIQTIKVLNFIATFDGIITSESNLNYLLSRGLEKFVSKNRHHLLRITETAYPTKIVKKTNKL